MSSACADCPHRPEDGRKGCSPCRGIQTSPGLGTFHYPLGMGGDSHITAATSSVVHLGLSGKEELLMNKGTVFPWAVPASSRKHARRSGGF